MFGKRTCTGQFHWKGQCLEIIQSYCYLGICLSSSGMYSEARKHVAKQARKATFPLLNLCARLNHPPMSVMLKLYEAYLIPIMCYGSEICGFQEDESIERVELWILKYMLHVPISTPAMAVQGELGQLPLHLWWKERILKYWNRISSGDIPSLLKDAANLLIHNVSSNSK